MHWNLATVAMASDFVCYETVICQKAPDHHSSLTAIHFITLATAPNVELLPCLLFEGTIFSNAVAQLLALVSTRAIAQVQDDYMLQHMHAHLMG